MTTKVIVCACEDVLLSEIEDAIAAGHRSIESLKRFLGCTTGVCQGKNCLVSVAEILKAQTGCKDAELRPIRARSPLSPIPLRLLASPDSSPP